jgi:uncharacterized protein (UPF0276 family)
MFKIATPLSKLFTTSKDLSNIIPYTDCYECRSFSLNFDADNKLLFHSDLQIIHPWGDKEYNFFKNFKQIYPSVKLISFHAASCCYNPLLSNGVFYDNGTLYTRNKLLKYAKKNIQFLRTVLSDDTIIAIENNNYYHSSAYQFVTDSDFLTELIVDNGVRFLFDLAHARVTSHNRKLNFNQYLAELPLNKIIQIHCSGILIEDDNAHDNHSVPAEEDWNLLQVFSKKKEVKFITIEYYKNIKNLVKILERLKDLQHELS